jgi:WD40 repeat protein
MMAGLLRGLLLSVIALVAGLVAADDGSAEPTYPAEPIAVIETGAHSASISRMAIDNGGRWAVTGSNDKTVRIWEAASGRLVSTVRVPLDRGDVGKIYAVAMSPDGRWVAAGGWSGDRIYILDRRTGGLVHVIEGLPNVVHDLAVSPDGRRLAAALPAGRASVSPGSYRSQTGRARGHAFDRSSLDAFRFGKEPTLAGR